MNSTLKLYLIFTIVIAIIVFAFIRARPYLNAGRSTSSDPDRKSRVKMLENAVVYQFDQVELERGSDDLRDGLHRAALAALRGLPANQRPDDASINAIAPIFAGYVVVCRSGGFSDYASWANGLGLEPIKPNTLATDKEDAYWQEGTAWARAATIDSATVEARTLFIRGQPQHGPFDRVFDSFGPMRELRSGGFLFSSHHDRSVIELSVAVIALSVDGRSTQPVRIGMVFANDNLNGSWKPMAVLARDVPPNFMLFLGPT